MTSQYRGDKNTLYLLVTCPWWERERGDEVSVTFGFVLQSTGIQVCGKHTEKKSFQGVVTKYYNSEVKFLMGKNKVAPYYHYLTEKSKKKVICTSQSITEVVLHFIFPSITICTVPPLW